MADDPAVPEHHEAMFRAIVETSPYLYAVVREDLTLGYVNPAAVEILGYEPGELVGRSATEIIHPDDFEVALGALTELVAEYDRQPGGGVPMPVRLIRSDGALTLVEVGAIPRLEDPHVQGTIIRGRPMAGQQSLDDALEALVASSPLEVVLEYLVSSLEHELRGVRAAMAYDWDGNGFRSVIAPNLAPALCGGAAFHESGDEPWVLAMARREPVAIPRTGDLAPRLAAVAVDAGLEACWVVPVIGVAGEDPVACLIVWRALAGQPLVSHEVALARASRLTSLAFERRRTEDLLRYAALHDNLTGVANRSQFFLRLQEATAPAAGAAAGPVRSVRGSLLAVLYLDLDDFKPVNDTHGHGQGDELLRAVTARIEATVRPDDLVARLGGDEFAVLCPDLRDPAEAAAIAERLIHEIARPVELGGVTVEVGLSVGVAVGDRSAGDGPQLLAAADAALYAAKRAGKGQWRLAP